MSGATSLVLMQLVMLWRAAECGFKLKFYALFNNCDV